MSFLDRTISDALTPTVGIPVRQTRAVPAEKGDIEPAPDVAAPVEAETQTHKSPLRVSGAGGDPPGDPPVNNDINQTEDDAAPDVQTPRRSAAQSGPLVVDVTEASAQEPLQRMPTTANHTHASPPRPRSPIGVQSPARTAVHDGDNEPQRAPAQLRTASPDQLATAQASHVPPSSERESAPSHRSSPAFAPLDTTTRAGQRASIPQQPSHSQFTDEPPDSPPRRAPDQDRPSEGELAAPRRDHLDVLTPAALPITTPQHPTPSSAPGQQAITERGPIIEIGRLEVIVEAPPAPVAAPTPPPPLPMPGIDTHRFTRRL